MRHLLQATATHLPLAPESVQCIVTSPPYWGLRAYAGEQSQTWGGDPAHEHDWAAVPGGESYTGASRWQHNDKEGRADQGITRATHPEAWAQIERGGTCDCGAWRGGLGLEPLPDCLAWARGEPPCPVCFVCHMRTVFAELWRVLRKDGTCFVNLGDSYATNGTSGGASPDGPRQPRAQDRAAQEAMGRRVPPGLKPKDLIGVPWRVALALQADGWWLRSEIIWAKPNPMPESVTDRPTKAHEQVFLLTKSARYFYDADGAREEAQYGRREQPSSTWERAGDADAPKRVVGATRGGDPSAGRNARTVWTIPTQVYPGSHFATFPEALAERCILAGTSPKACGVCAAPWARVVERTGNYEGERAGATVYTGQAYDHPQSAPRGPASNFGETRTLTIGWAATCSHNDDTGRCVVLDPFAGTGTVARVALRHGRHAVGIDISREYLLEHAMKRADRVQTEMGI